MLKFKAAGHFAGITDTREINPWEIPGFYITIKRDGIKGWQDWLKENQGENPLAAKIARESVRLALSNRRLKKSDKLSDQELMDTAVNRATERLEPGKQPDLDSMKAGVAEHLIAGWRGVEVALKACTKCKHEWSPDGFGEPCPECGDLVSVDVGSALEPTPENKLKLLENSVDDNGDVRWVPREVDGKPMQCGGQPFGDALMFLIIEEAGEIESFRREFAEGGAKNS